MRTAGPLDSRRQTMREAAQMASPPILALLLSTWRADAALGRETTATSTCESNYLTVVATNFAAIAGCYRKINSFVANDRSIYTNKGREIEGITYGILGSRLSAGRTKALEYVDNGLRWVVCEIALPDHYEDGADASTTVEVKEVVCTSGSDWWEMRSPTKVQDWECHTEEYVRFNLEERVITVTCGCSAVDEGESATRDVTRGGSGSFNRALSATSARSMSRAASVVAHDGATMSPSSFNAESSHPNSNWSGQISSFWTWVFFMVGIVGLTMLCCIVLCFRSPWCKRQPPVDPNAPVEDAAPRAPWEAFQPWGASAPPS